MKKFVKAMSVFAALAMLGAGFISCSSDDGDDDKKAAKYTCENCETEYDTEAEKDNCKTKSGCPKYEAPTKYTCDNCKTEYDSQAKKDNCATKEGCPKYAAPAANALSGIWKIDDYVANLGLPDVEKNGATIKKGDLKADTTMGKVTAYGLSDTTTISVTDDGTTDLDIDGTSTAVKGYLQLGKGGSATKKGIKFTVAKGTTKVSVYAKNSSKTDASQITIAKEDGTVLKTLNVPNSNTANYVAYETDALSLTADTVICVFNDGTTSGVNVKAVNVK